MNDHDSVLATMVPWGTLQDSRTPASFVGRPVDMRLPGLLTFLLALEKGAASLSDPA